VNLKVWELIGIILSTLVTGVFWGPWVALSRSPFLTGIPIGQSSSKTSLLHLDQSPVNNLPASQ
jgi:MFS-type transporter involved in bile tolerance (Atg22 family)